MDFLELAKSRHSIRDYLNKPVDDALIEQVLEAARWAPSACNIQPTLFIVLNGKEPVAAMRSIYAREWILRAPVIIAACCDRSACWHRADNKDYGDIDAAISLDHLTLAATQLGLGTCWIGAFNADEARRVLRLPPHIDPIAFTPLGYPGPLPPRPQTRKSLGEIVFRGYYGNQ